MTTTPMTLSVASNIKVPIALRPMGAACPMVGVTDAMLRDAARAPSSV
jgi:hypothetical protein